MAQERTPNEPKGKTVPVRLYRDVWGENEERFKAGEVHDLPIETAKRLIKEGKAERADPMPGDD